MLRFEISIMRLTQSLCIIAVFSTAAAAFESEHLTQLKDTNECFNCDLSGADLSGIALQGAELKLANLKDVQLENST